MTPLDTVAGPAITEPAPAVTPKRRRSPAYRPMSEPPPGDPRPVMRDARAVFLASADIASADREHFVVFDLDVRHRVIARRIVSIGHLCGVEVHPREIFRGAIVNGAAAIILAHNHPSGDPSPSSQDIEMTARLRDVGKLCGIPVLDHVVVSTGGYVSLQDRGFWSCARDR